MEWSFVVFGTLKGVISPDVMLFIARMTFCRVRKDGEAELAFEGKNAKVQGCAIGGALERELSKGFGGKG